MRLVDIGLGVNGSCRLRAKATESSLHPGQDQLSFSYYIALYIYQTMGCPNTLPKNQKVVVCNG